MIHHRRSWHTRWKPSGHDVVRKQRWQIVCFMCKARLLVLSTIWKVYSLGLCMGLDYMREYAYIAGIMHVWVYVRVHMNVYRCVFL